MNYIQKKRVKLILLGLGVIALYIYLLGVMTAHAAWVKMEGLEYTPVYGFYFDDKSVKIDRNAKIVSYTIMFHFTPQGAKDFVRDNRLDPAIHADFTYAVSKIEIDYGNNRFRFFGTAAAYDSKNRHLSTDEEAPPESWKPIGAGSVAEGWLSAVRSKYNF